MKEEGVRQIARHLLFLVICSKEVQVVGFLYIEEEQER